MWKKEDAKAPGAPQTQPPANTGFPQSSTISSTTPSNTPTPAATAPPVSARATACISQGIRIKGEITGKEDLFVDGSLEGKLDLGNASVTIGPNGKIKADIFAREVVVRGQVEGIISGTEKVQLWSTGWVNGEVRTDRLSIEDGAMLRGKVEAGKANARSAEVKSKAAAADSGDSGKGTAATSRTAVI